MDTTKGIRSARYRIAEIGVRQADLAMQLGMHESRLSALLNGRLKPPPDFVERVHAALDRLEAAERAADEARRRVLAGGAV